MFICELCNRNVPTVTKHHLVPREHGGKNHPTTMLCIACHKQIHALFSNKELFVRFFTIERLKRNEKIQRYLKFVNRIPGDTHIDIKKSKEARKRA